MVKKKGKTISEDIETLLTEQELAAREQKYLQRLQDIGVSVAFMNVASNEHKALKDKEFHEDRWLRYLSCDGLPLPDYPPIISNFLARNRHFADVDADANIDWTLSVDERSILCQDIFRKDMTRKNLYKTKCPNIGALFDRFIDEILKTIQQIFNLMDNEELMSTIPLARSVQIMLARSELMQEIDVFFDMLTYRIISASDSYMSSTDGREARYCYKSENYNFQIWCLRDVPIRFKFLEPPAMCANFDCAGVLVQIPLSVLKDNVTLRCVHTFFDPYTEQAKSYDLFINQSTTNLNAGMMDIEDCLINEWEMQMDIELELREKMYEKMANFEETMRTIEAKTELAKKNREEGTKINIPKVPKEPQALPEGMFPDPYNLFLIREQKQYIDFLDGVYHPSKLELTPDEINLRQYIILGGIYSMLFVRKPKNTDFQKYNITIHENARSLFTFHDVVVDLHAEEEYAEANQATLANVSSGARKSVSKARSGFKERRSPMESPRHSAPYANMHLGVDELVYFYVTFKLPKHLCLWGNPEVCQFIEEYVEPVREYRIETEPEITTGKKKKQRHKSVFDNLNENTNTFAGLKKGVDTGAFKFDNYVSVIQRKSQNPSNIYRSTVLSCLRHSAELPKVMGPSIPLKNFELCGNLLTVANIRNIQRHLLPLLISSFKFPLEFRDEKLDEDKEKEGQPNMLMRRQQVATTQEEDTVPKTFNFEDQTRPERVYPIFENRENVLRAGKQYEDVDKGRDRARDSDDICVMDDSEDSDSDTEPLRRKTIVLKEPTIYGMIDNFQDIQNKYLKRPAKINDQKVFSMRSKAIKVVQESTVVPMPPRGRTKSIISTRSRTKRLTKGSISRHSEMEPGLFRPRESSTSGKGNYAEGSQIVFTKKIEPPKLDSPKEPELVKQKVLHWTKKYIDEAVLDKEKLTLTVKTDRLGIFGFAYPRYAHFPFRHWSVEANDENNDEIIFTLDTFHVRVVLYISEQGVHGYVRDLVKEFVAQPLKYLVIEKPITDFKELRRVFQEKNVNIFAQHDACFYIDNGYFSEKHLATELHIYDVIALHCKLINFYRSSWNRLATRRNIVLCLRSPKDLSEGSDVTVRITPENSSFVEIQELCSDDLEVFKLDYKLTWRNIGTYSDLHQLINSMYPQATDVRNKQPHLMYFIKKLLSEVRPLSFS